MVLLSLCLLVIALVAVGSGLYWAYDGSPGFGAMGVLLGITTGALAISYLLSPPEEPSCETTYNPDGSYVEVCEYPGDE